MKWSQPEPPPYGFRCPPSSTWKGEPVLYRGALQSHTQISRAHQLHSGNTGAPQPRNARANEVPQPRHPTGSGSELTAQTIESYNKKNAKVCGTFGMIGGLVCASLNVAMIAMAANTRYISYINNSGYGIWGGAVCFIAGLLQFISGFKTSKSTVLATFVSSIIAIVVYLLILTMTFMNFGGISEEYKPRLDNNSSRSSVSSRTLMPLSFAMFGGVALGCVAAVFACILSAAIIFRTNEICRYKPTSNDPSSTFTVSSGMSASTGGCFGASGDTSGGIFISGDISGDCLGYGNTTGICFGSSDTFGGCSSCDCGDGGGCSGGDGGGGGDG